MLADPLPRVHDLRHTAASLAIQAGAHPRLIMDMFGHSSIVVTIDRYGHLFPSVAEQLADKLDAAFREASGRGPVDYPLTQAEGANVRSLPERPEQAP